MSDIADNVPSYPSIFAVGHRVLVDIFNDPVIVEEKIDGSQISFGVLNGKLCARSKNKQIDLDAPDSLFTRAVETIKELEPLLEPGFLYRGEYLQKPKHNALAYDRVPNKHIIIYDVQDCEFGGESQHFLTPGEKFAEAARIGLECVPLLHEQYVNSPETLKRLVATTSVLGGPSEGVVVKNYNRYGPDKKILLAKYVTDSFKEIHQKEWKAQKGASKLEFIEHLISQYATPARFQKAVQHLKERGELTQSPKDIGPLMAEVGQDIEKECKEEIAQKLFDHFWKQIIRGITKGVPQFYKELLVAVDQTYGAPPTTDVAPLFDIASYEAIRSGDVPPALEEAA